MYSTRETDFNVIYVLVNRKEERFLDLPSVTVYRSLCSLETEKDVQNYVDTYAGAVFSKQDH
jgi:hypothetical protein